jgi:DMSO/TMAO reductase YedYZ molybdopterin-dependent catalytic subunit
MPGSTRRRFLLASGATAAAAGVAAVLPSTAEAATARAAKPVMAPADAAPLVAHISNPATGEVSLLVGEREVVVHDRDLVGRLTRAAKGA